MLQRTIRLISISVLVSLNIHGDDAVVCLENYTAKTFVYCHSIGGYAPVEGTRIQVLGGSLGGTWQPLSSPFGLSAPGQFDHGLAVVAGVPGGDTAQFQVLAWRNAASFEQADERGQSPVFTQKTGIIPSLPSPPLPLPLEVPSFSITPVSTPLIQISPAGATVVEGSNVVLAVVADGTPPHKYQWQFNGIDLVNAGNIGGVTNSSLHILAIRPDQAGEYRVIVSNVTVLDTSHVAVVTVLMRPRILINPVHQVVNAGQSANFSVLASGTLPLSCQWRFNNRDLPGQTYTNLIVSSVTAAHAGDYSVVVSNAVGAEVSATATLTVRMPPEITGHPASQVVTAGETASFQVTASSQYPLSYRWRHNDVIMPGATNSVLNIAAASTNDAGRYEVTVTNIAGSARSRVAYLTVRVPPAILVQPQDQRVRAGTQVAFAVSASGTAPLAYQWRFGAHDIPGATQSVLNLPQVSTNQTGDYSLLVSNEVGWQLSRVAHLEVTHRFPWMTLTKQANELVLSWFVDQNHGIITIYFGANLDVLSSSPGTVITTVVPASLQGSISLGNPESQGSGYFYLLQESDSRQTLTTGDNLGSDASGEHK